MKKSLVLAMAMALGVTASAYAANPFSDVPAGHWAYDSVAKLAAAGVVDGYADGAFDGDKLMTRYEMAQIVAKAMAKGADCDKLAAEFADELDTLGVRVAKLEKKADNVKVSGETRLRYWNDDVDGDKTQLRTRIWVKGDVNEDWKVSAMLENVQKIGGEVNNESGEEDTKLQRAYVNGKIGGLAVQAGRYGWIDFNNGLIYDTRMDGFQVQYGKDIKVKAAVGKASNGDGLNKTYKWAAEDMALVEVGTKIGVVDAKVGYYEFEDAVKLGTDVEIYTVGAALPLAKGLKLHGTYLINETELTNADDGFVVGLQYNGAKAAKAGSWGLWANWYDQPAGTYVEHTMEATYANFANATDNGFEGFGVGLDYAIAKNMVLQAKWYDLEGRDGATEQEMFYSQLNVTF